MFKVHIYDTFSEDGEGRPPIRVKFEIPYFTTSGIQVSVIGQLGLVASWSFYSPLALRLLFGTFGAHSIVEKK